MREITVGSPKERKVLKINIGEESYSLPLLGSLTIKEVNGLESEKGMLDFIKRHIPDEVFDELTVYDLKTIASEWRSASESDVASLGES